ncbi:MAG: fructose-bisphosphatase, class II [Candidatus Buchananbacteria bacterium RIFCSPHIGHO2_02_FULL_56_16]|uniref:Fructose-1,6-bisphosphatase n=1 Tax=Candidatus Buchananbacteria bacterium RIFCSPHIGHO2_02_FULL_56_16 TaxID=1797542 RepID=A0A1G1YGA4_9BACT|nr:MAG: fructose-bisphosphatase, class II [Candidatus Buchananbacteria bacterium RIFCSPHIGHO2_02_FULL_56_16]
MDRNLALEFVRVTEAAAIAAAKWIGRGDKHAADQAAVDEMRARFNQIDFSGTVVIGEGSKDEAPELYTGEQVGSGKEPMMDLAVDPLEATDSVAFGRSNALSVIVTGPPGSLLHAPDTYMEKIAVGKDAAKVIDLDAPVADNIKKVAAALGKDVSEIVVMVLDRPRHEQLINDIRKVGARVRLITDGDVAAAIATCRTESGIDLMLGTGGSTEAVLAAAPVKILGGQILCRFKPRSADDEQKIKAAGVSDVNETFTAEDLAKGNTLTFTATGVIDGPLLPGILFRQDRIITHSIVIRATSGTVRYITTHHNVN